MHTTKLWYDRNIVREAEHHADDGGSQAWARSRCRLSVCMSMYAYMYVCTYLATVRMNQELVYTCTYEIKACKV
jgi:hypothetical protein